MNPYRGINPVGTNTPAAAIAAHEAAVDPHPQYGGASGDLDNIIDGITSTLEANKSRVYASPLTITATGALQIPATSQVAFVG